MEPTVSSARSCHYHLRWILHPIAVGGWCSICQEDDSPHNESVRMLNSTLKYTIHFSSKYKYMTSLPIF